MIRLAEKREDKAGDHDVEEESRVCVIKYISRFQCNLNEVRIQDEVLCRKTSERDVSLNSSVPSKPAASPSGSSDFCFISKGFDTAAVDSPDSRCLQRLSSSPVLEASDLLVRGAIPIVRLRKKNVKPPIHEHTSLERLLISLASIFVQVF